AQQRRGRMIPLPVLLRRHGGQTIAGLLVTIYLAWLTSPLLLWMLPMTIGLILAIPLSALSGSQISGTVLARCGLLHTPEEQAPPAIVRRRRSHLETFSAAIENFGCSSVLHAGAVAVPEKPPVTLVTGNRNPEARR
ncbi:MAG: hypothetical protein KJN90_15260, partial [Gammaproteobacteria bacterium]|nr:hypothetical protein [Gammaproteobacteria bacterium]